MINAKPKVVRELIIGNVVRWPDLNWRKVRSVSTDREGWTHLKLEGWPIVCTLNQNVEVLCRNW